MKMLTPSLLVAFCVLVVGARADTPEMNDRPMNSKAESTVKTCAVDHQPVDMPAKALLRIPATAKAAQFEPCVYRGEEYEVSHPVYRGEKLDVSHPLYRGEKYEIIHLFQEGSPVSVTPVKPEVQGQLGEGHTVLTCTEDRIRESAEALSGGEAPSKEGADNGKDKGKSE